MRRWNRWVIAHPLPVLLAIALLTLGLGLAARSIGFSTDLQEMLPADDPSVREYVEVSRLYGSQDFLLIAVRTEPTVFNPGTLRKIWELTAQLEALPTAWVEEVRTLLNAEVVEGTATSLTVRPAAERLPQTPEEIAAFRQRVLQERLLRRLLLSADERTTLIIVEERVEIVESEAEAALVQAVEALVEPYRGPERIVLSGGPYITSQLGVAMVQDLKALIPLAIGVLLLVLWLSFRQPRGMILPLAVVLLSVVWTLGGMALLGFKLTIVSVVVPVILIAIGNADSIHILTRYQETLHREPDRQRALALTLDALSRPVIFTSLTSAAGFLGLATSYSVIIQQFGLATAVGILFAMGLSLTFLPAVLALLPARSASHLRPAPAPELTAEPDRRRARRGVAGAFLVLALGLGGLTRLEINNNPLDYLRADSPVVRSARFVEETFGGSLTLRISLDAGRPDRWKDPAWLRQVAAFQAELERLPHVGVSTSLADVVRELNLSLHGDDPAYDALPEDLRVVAQELLLFEFGGGSDLGALVRRDYAEGQITLTVASVPLKELKPLIRRIRALLAERFPAARVRLTGPPMLGLRLGETLIQSQIQSLGLSLLLVWAMLGLLTRSARLSLIGVVPLGFAVGLALGGMGYLGVALDLGTVMVASVSIGIGVDFAIHFIARYQQARACGARPPAAVRAARQDTGRALLYNTLSLGLGFSVMLGSQFTANLAFGALVGVTVLVAFVTTLGLVPALLVLTSRAP